MATLIHLTKDERRVAQAILRGENAHLTCNKLGIPESRYKAHVQHILHKTGSRDHLELISKLRHSITGT
jgi:DNA-binding NarL/FixJ family response regulator